MRLASLGLALLAFAACTTTKTTFVDEPIPSDDTKDGGFAAADPDSGLGELTIRPDVSYSGYDGENPFTVPIAVYDSGDDLTVTSDDATAVTITPKQLKSASGDNGKWFFIGVKKAGTFTLSAKSNGKTSTSTLNVTPYATGRWTTGMLRYMNGGGDDVKSPKCTNCHVNGQAIDHSPAALATVADEAVGVIITTGISPGGFPIKIDGVPGHMWEVKDSDELDGLITYLRGLDPRGFQ